MDKHDVSFDSPAQTGEIEFSDVFNVSVPFIDRHVHEGRGERIAIQEAGGGAVSYAELAANVGRCAGALRQLGLREGARALMVVTDGPMFIYTFWGAVKAGIVPIPVNTLMSAGDYRFLVDDCECAVVVYSPEYADKINSACAQAAHKPATLATDRGGRSLWALMQAVRAGPEPAETRPDSECFWLYSSGSTGNPKGVVHEHKDMVVTSVRFGQGIAGITAQDLVYCASKLFFSYGFGGGMTFPLWCGATTLLCAERTTPGLVTDNIQKYRPDVFFGVPTLYGQVLHHTDGRDADLSSIKCAVSAGEALPAPVFERFKQRFGISILDGIGSTEALHIFISNRNGDVKPGTSGRPVPGYLNKIVDENNREAGPGDIGTLWIKSASTARCYWKNPQKTAGTMVDGWLNTGDMYYMDEEGYFVNAGRGDDMLKVGGMWCSPIEIESCLLQHPAVREAAVVGRKDDAGMVKPEAFIVCKNNATGAEQLQRELHELCKQQMAGYKYPRWYHLVDELPKTTTGKIQRFKLR